MSCERGYWETVSHNVTHWFYHHQPVNSRLHSRNSFILTSQPLLCKPAEAGVAKWQEQWEGTDSNLWHPPKRTTPEWSHTAVGYMTDGQPSALGTCRHPSSETPVGLPGEQTLCGTATCDLDHILTSCKHFGERPSKDERDCENGDDMMTVCDTVIGGQYHTLSDTVSLWGHCH